MNLNLATAAFFSGLVEISLCMGMLVIWSRERARHLIYWSMGFLSWGVGALLVSLRDIIPDFISIVFANFISILSSVLFYIGICIFFNLRRSGLIWTLLILGAGITTLTYYTYVTYDTSARIYAYSGAQMLITSISAYTLFKANRERVKIVNHEVLVVTIVLMLIYGSRIFSTPFFPAPQNYLASGNVQTLLASGLLVLHITYALVFGSAALSEARMKEQQKVEMLSYITHDLRAPLATISGYSQILLADAPSDQRKALETIQRSVKYQLDLVDELMDYTKAELQPLTIKPSTTDLCVLLGSISEYAVALCSLKNNRFLYQAPERLPRRISVDGQRLQQVLLNLISNAAKFTRDGVVTLSVSAKPAGTALTLHFTVIDTGIGIDLNQNINIFGAFQQVQAASGSNGLGLFIAQRIVTAMGGSLDVASSPGVGTAFSFGLSVPITSIDGDDWFLPLASDSEAPAHSPESLSFQSGIPSNQALNDLADLALNGCLTDIERWINDHATEAVYAPFVAKVKELLDQFDFSVIHALALLSRSSKIADTTDKGILKN